MDDHIAHARNKVDDVLTKEERDWLISLWDTDARIAEAIIHRLSAEVTALRANQKLSAEDYAALRAWSENPKPPATMTAGVVRDAADAVWPQLAKLRAVVEKLPKTKDRVSVTPGMPLWRPERFGPTMAHWVGTHGVRVDPSTDEVWAAEYCYSTEAGAAAQRDAARAAHDAKEKA